MLCPTKTFRFSSTKHRPSAFPCQGGFSPPLDPPPPKTMSRPRKTDPLRTVVFRVRLTEGEFEQLTADADTAGVDLSTMARAQILGAPTPTRARRRSVDHETLGRVLAELGRIGGNLNQMAKVANQVGDLTSLRNGQAMTAELSAIRELVREALNP